MMFLPNTRLNAAIQHLINVEQSNLVGLTDEYLADLGSGQVVYGKDNSDVPLIDTIARIKGLRTLSQRLGLSGDQALTKPRSLKRQFKRLAREIAFYTAEAKDISESTDSIAWTATYANLEAARKLIFELLEGVSKKPVYQTLSILEDKVPNWNELASDEASRT